MDKTVSSLAGIRGEAYRFLTMLFASPPDIAVIRGMQSLACGSDEESSFVDNLRATLSAHGDLESHVERLNVEHVRLFRGISEDYGPPPPYESMWREGQLMGESTVAVAQRYLDAGFVPDPRFAPCDHLVEELRFMATLCKAEEDAQGKHREVAQGWQCMQSRFLDQHLRTWIAPFCQRIAAESREPFYAELAKITASVIDHDAEFLRSI